MGYENRGENVHGELVTDGPANTAAVMLLYKSGTTTARSLASDEFLHITDVLISIETAADVTLWAGAAAAAGKYIFSGAMGATSVWSHHFAIPYVCPVGATPYFAGAATNRSSCLIEGFITK